MKMKVKFGWLSFTLDISFDEFLKLLDLLRKVFPSSNVHIVSTYQTCYTCKHFGDREYCDKQDLHYGKRTCTGFENFE